MVGGNTKELCAERRTRTREVVHPSPARLPPPTNPGPVGPDTPSAPLLMWCEYIPFFLFLTSRDIIPTSHSTLTMYVMMFFLAKRRAHDFSVEILSPEGFCTVSYFVMEPGNFFIYFSLSRKSPLITIRRV